MADNFQYGRCLPWRATISTEFCRIYQASGKDKCQTCKGLIMDSSTDKPIETNADSVATQRPAFQDRLRSLMNTKPATYRDVAEAVGLSHCSVRAWAGGNTIPTVNQAQLLDDFFSTNLVEEYKDLLRKVHGNKCVKIDRAAKTKATKPDPDKETSPRNHLTDILKGAANLEKRLEAHQEIYGDSEAAAVDMNDRQMALVVLFKALECLSLIMGEQAEDYGD